MTALLLEREAQVAALEALTAAARGGAGRLVTIEGGAGIGKSRLLGEARSVGGRHGLQVLAARGGELERDFVHGIVRQLFEPLLAAADPALRAELLGGAASLAEGVFGEAGLSPETDGGGAPFAVLHGLYWLAANIALHQPTVLAIDDLHWADAPSLRWLGHLARRLDGLPLLVVVATRAPEGASTEPGLISELLLDPYAVAIRPEPLSEASIAILAREQHGLEPDEAFCVALVRATGGTPLLVHAVLDTVARDGAGASVARLEELGAHGVSRAVRSRLAHLSPAALALVRAASILGEDSELHHAAALAGTDTAQLGPAAAELVAHDLLRKADPIEFVHPVVCGAVRDTLDVVERGQAHRRAARLLAGAGAPTERAAAHLAAAPPSSDPVVVATLRRAAQDSLAQGGPDAGVAYLTRALAEGSPPPVRAEVLVELGMAERRTDGPAASQHLRDGLGLTADPVRRGEIALELGRVLWFTDRHEDAQEAIATALEDIDAAVAPELHELLVAELISAAWWRPESHAVALAELGGLDLDRLHGGRGTEILLATMAHHEYRLGADRDRAVDLARRALASGRLAASGSVAFSYAAYAFQLAGLFDEGLAVCNGSLARARRRGDIFHVASTFMWRGRCNTLVGDLPAAVADLREAADLSRQHGVRVSWPLIVAFLVDALLERGEHEEAARVVAEAGFPDELPMNLLTMFFAVVRGRLRVEAGDLQRGLDDLLLVADSTQLIPSDNPVLRPWRRWAVEALHRLGREGEARTLAAEDLVLARRWGAPHGIGTAQRVLGLVSDDEALLREAVATLAGSGARAEHARALVDLGAALRRANRRTEARAVLREGVDLAHAVGATGLAGRGNEEIAATGARPRKVLRTGLDALTASERRVAQMAAEGLTNREIAQALFVTVKTVEVHLSSVYRKLSIESRTQLHRGLRSTHVPQHP